MTHQKDDMDTEELAAEVKRLAEEVAIECVESARAGKYGKADSRKSLYAAIDRLTALASKPDAAPAGTPYTTEQAAELAGRFKLPLRMEYDDVFRADCEAVAQLINHVRENSGDVMLWAHIAKLEAAMKGPDGFETWQDAATDERIRRVAAERKLASSAAPAGGAVEALRWYADEAKALAKHMEGGAHTQAVLASVTVLALDAGRRAEAALAAAPVVPPSILGAPASPSGSTLQPPAAASAPIPGAARPDYAFPLALDTKHRDCHKAADAFWKHWEKYGETHRHGYYESTWGAINCAIRMIGVREHHYGQMYGGDARGIVSPEGVETHSGSTAKPQEPGPEGSRPEDRADGADQSNSGETA